MPWHEHGLQITTSTTNQARENTINGNQDSTVPLLPNESFRTNMPSANSRANVPSTPSAVSPVGDGGQYSMTVDDDDDDEVAIPAFPSSGHQGNVDEEDDWQYFDEPPSRFSINENNNNSMDDLRRPLLSQLEHQRSARLTCVNYLNFATYLANLFVSYGIGVWGLGGYLPTRWEISKENATLITPAPWSYYLWAPILVSEAFFAIMQLLPHFRARPIIQDGTGFFFFYTCIIQTAWTLFFSFRLFLLSFIAVLAALLSMISLLASQHYSQTRGRKSRTEYFLFKFPFYLHCGWLILCSVVQLSMVFRHYTSNVGVQLAADVVSLGVMLPAATFFLTGQPSGPDFVIPLVVIYSYVSAIHYFCFRDPA